MPETIETLGSRLELTESSTTALSEPKGLHRWAVVTGALLPGLVIGMMIALVIPIIPAIASHFGGSSGGRLLAQYFVAISGVGTMVGASIGGIGVDRVGFRPVVVASLVLYMIAGMSGAVIDNANLALTARVLIGVGSGGFATAAFALLGQRWHGPDRARMLGYVTAIGAGAAIPLIILSGVVSQHFGWRTPFLLFGLALPLLLLSLFLPSDRRQRDRRARPILPSEWRSIAPVLLMGMALYLILFVVSIQFPLLLADAGFHSAEQRSVILGAPSLAGVISALLFARLSRVIDRPRMTMFILVLYGGGFAAMSVVHGLATALTASVLCGFALGLTPSHVSRELLERAAADIRGRAGAALTLSRYTAQILNPVILGTIGSILGLRVTLRLVCCALLIWLAIAAWQEFSRTRLKVQNKRDKGEQVVLL